MYRDKLLELVKWKERASRAPLIIRGARQVGKSWLVREHGKIYTHFIEVNLELMPELIEVFNDLYGKPKDLIETLAIKLKQDFSLGETLLFIDEIQECKNAIKSLRSFKELLPKLHVIAAGSLLEFALEELSFPVGRVDFLYMHPLSFSEFLKASNPNLLELTTEQKLNFHDDFLQEWKKYIILGGMPEVVATFLETNSYDEAQLIQSRLIESYRRDFYKYAKHTDIEILTQLFAIIPRFVGQQVKYTSLVPGKRIEKIKKGISLLAKSGILLPCYHSNAKGLPLGAEVKARIFKLFFVDIGLTLRFQGLNMKEAAYNIDMEFINKGALAEQFFAQELISETGWNDFPQLYFWQRQKKNSSAEVDFIISRNQKIIPVEIKSGKNSKIKSVRMFLQETGNEQGIQLSPANKQISSKDGIRYLPIWLHELI